MCLDRLSPPHAPELPTAAKPPISEQVAAPDIRNSRTQHQQYFRYVEFCGKKASTGYALHSSRDRKSVV